MLKKEIGNQKWEGKLLIISRWEDDDLYKACFTLISEWKTALTDTILGFKPVTHGSLACLDFGIFSTLWVG